MVRKTIEQITGIEDPKEIPFYRESVLMLKRTDEEVELLIDDAAKYMHYRTWEDFCLGLARIDGTREHFKKLAGYFGKQATKYFRQQPFERFGKKV